MMLRSKRFAGLEIVLTAHARQRALERNMSEQVILDIIDNGEQKEAHPGHYWFFKHHPERDDNLLCIAAVVDNVLVIKTVMHHWRPAP
jgi:hypothetical protein